jgi:hypothetical protein
MILAQSYIQHLDSQIILKKHDNCLLEIVNL